MPAFFPSSPLVASLFISLLYRLIVLSEVEKRTEIIPNSQLGRKRWNESVVATIENGRLTALTATMHRPRAKPNRLLHLKAITRAEYLPDFCGL